MTLVLAQKFTRQKTKHLKMKGDGAALREGEEGAHSYRGTRNRQTPQELTGTWEQAKVGKWGESIVTGHGGRRRHAA